jgi:hypothetical protein
MSATTVILAVEGVLLAVALVFIVALLRSHAEILRRLGALDAGAAEPGPANGLVPAGSGGGGAAYDLAGQTLAGDACKLAVAERSSSAQTLLAFLSSGCTACGPIWAALRDGARPPTGARLVIVTKDRERESAGALAQLAPAGQELVMSSTAWRQYEVPATPHFVLVDGVSGEIAGRGSAGDWDQLVTLVERANADLAHANAAAKTPERAARADQALARAGITPGHPSLYPSGERDGTG